MYHVSLGVQCIWMECEGDEDEDGNEGSELPGGWKRVEIAGLLYADDLVLCGESDEDLRVMVGWFADVCRRR